MTRHWSDARKLVRAILLSFLAATACRSIVDPPLPDAVQPFAPPPVYTQWWAMTESCSRLTGSLDKVSWYTVPGSFFVPMEGDQVVAYWSRSNNRIVIGERFILNGAVVRHEMLHALEGHSGHPQADFLDKCGRVVLCSDGCVAEGGPRGTFPLEDLYDLRTVKKAPSILSP